MPIIYLSCLGDFSLSLIKSTRSAYINSNDNDILDLKRYKLANEN